MLDPNASADVHRVLDLIQRIDGQGGPRPGTSRAKYLAIRRRVLEAVAENSTEDLKGLAGVDDLGAWPILVAQLSAFLIGGYLVYETIEPLKQATKTVVWAGAAYLIWSMFQPRRRRAA